MSRTHCLYNVNVVDAEAGAIARDQTVIVQEGRVSALEPTSPEWSAPSTDGQGLYLCPGLIDCHVHLFLDASSTPRRHFLEADDDARLEIAERNARSALEAGITTVRDCGAPAPLMFELQRRVGRKAVVGPRIVSCGSPLMRPGGHCHFFGGEVADAAAVRRTIERQLRQGASFVKLIASGGGLTPGTNPSEADMPLELMAAAADVARANGATVTAHCHATESIVRAIDAGLDMIEHCSFVEPPERHCYSEEITRRIADRGIVVSPTVYGALRTARRMRESNGVEGSRQAAAIERLEGRLTNAAHFVRLGLKIIGGTDCGVTDTPFDSLVDELLCYTNVGMSNADALRAVTSQTAALLRIDGVGAVKPGYQADFLLLAANPLDDLEALREPLAVYQAGEIVHRRQRSPASDIVSMGS